MIGSQVLGQGTYATVRVGFHVPSQMEVAVKVYQKAKLFDRQRMQSVANEISILSKARNAGIVKLYQKIEDNQKIYLVMEFCGNTNLKEFLKKLPNQILNEAEVKVLFRKIAEAVEYLHVRGIAHRDLKLQNVVLNSVFAPKLVDFGFASKTSSSMNYDQCGTPNYMAPELVGRKKNIDPLKSDIWAMGIILYYLITNNHAFKASSEQELFKRIVHGGFDLNPVKDPQLKNLLENLLRSSADKRLSISQVLSHPWLAN